MKAELLDHRKFLRLKRLLGEPTPHVLGYLLLMWRRGYQTGNPELGDELDVEAAAEFLGEPRKFATAALDAGFLDRLPNGRIAIHDLYDHAPKYAQMRIVRRGNAPESAKPSVVRTDQKEQQKGTRVPQKEETKPARTPKVRGQSTEVKGKSENPSAEAGGAADPPPAVRARDELFDAIAEVTGSAPGASGSHIGRVKKRLLEESPPFTPDEVRRMGDPDFLEREMGWTNGRKPTLGEIEKYIGRVRNPSKPTQAKPQGQRFQTRGESLTASIMDTLASTLGVPDPEPES